MDDTDRKILSILEKNSRTPFLVIAKQLNISEGAIRKRVKELMKTGIIKKFTVISGPEKKLRALILCMTTPQVPVPEVANKVRTIAAVKEVYELSGEYDIIAFVDGDSVREINNAVDTIREVKGVIKTVTTFILH